MKKFSSRKLQTTDERRSASICTAKPKILSNCQGFSSAGLLGAHASCVPGVGHRRHAGSVRSQGTSAASASLRVRLGVLALACTARPGKAGIADAQPRPHRVRRSQDQAVALTSGETILAAQFSHRGTEAQRPRMKSRRRKIEDGGWKGPCFAILHPPFSIFDFLCGSVALWLCG